jgi:aminoglycoside 6'-N-acetyltransferase
LSHGVGRSRSSPRLCARLFDAGATAIGVDPPPDNARAIRAYQKAGFAIVSGLPGTRWGSRGGDGAMAPEILRFSA